MPERIEQEQLARYTSWRIGGPARFMADVASPEALLQQLEWAQQQSLPVALLGGGTNTLALDTGYPGLIIRYRDQTVRIEQDRDQALVTIAAGAPMAGTVRRLARQGWAGLEWAEGLPGTLGGAVFGNAGCYGGDIAAVLQRAWLLVAGQVEEWPVERFGFGYRTSLLKQGPQPAPVVLAAELRLERAEPEDLAKKMQATAEARRSKTPAGQSCGSVFKNPTGESAGRLIEMVGLKGFRVGNAEIAQKHANYIVNLGNASSTDLLRLIELARTRVFQQAGIELELEVRVLGNL